MDIEGAQNPLEESYFTASMSFPERLEQLVGISDHSGRDFLESLLRV